MKSFLTILLAVPLTVAVPVTWGQAQRIQGGNVLDANPQLGSAGINSGTRQYNTNMGNRIVSGNVTGGVAFRGFSPIRDPNSLFISVPRATGGLGGGPQTGLPSDQLSNFQRDTFNVADLQRGWTRGGAPLPYYSPQGTVANTGAIAAGLNRPGTSQLKSPYMDPRTTRGPQDNRLLTDRPVSGGTLLKVPPQVARIDTGQLIKGPVNERLLNSPLFGAVRMVPGDVLANQAATEQALGAEMGGPLDQRVNRMEPLDMRVGDTANRAGSPRSAMDRVLGQRGPAGAESNRPQPLDMRVGGPEALPNQGNVTANQSINKPARSTDRQQQARQTRATGDAHDVFSGMRMASGQLLRPLKPPLTLGQQARVEQEKQGASPGLVQPLKSVVAEPPQTPLPEAPQGVTIEQQIEIAKKVTSEPIKSFVGTEESAINKYLAEAEQLMRDGQYYKASNVYDLVRTIDVNNPLPLLGRAMSLLAAGEYMSSATNLFQAIRLFEELANFPIDLTAFIPDVAALDRRRADLERRLESFEEYRLRFLLGYAEYNSGLQKMGLANMKRAADSVPPEWSAVPNFVKLLEQRQLLAPATQPGSVR